MDAHYEQVMKQREAQKDAAPRLYFAYSTILDREALTVWRSQHGYPFFDLPPGIKAEALDVDIVFDFPSRFWGGRVAGLADKEGASVWGLLFTIPGVDWPVIRHKEGALTNMCVEREVRVRSAGGETFATAFVTRPERQSREGDLSKGFVEALIRGANSAGLPESYIQRLNAFL